MELVTLITEGKTLAALSFFFFFLQLVCGDSIRVQVRNLLKGAKAS